MCKLTHLGKGEGEGLRRGVRSKSVMPKHEHLEKWCGSKYSRFGDENGRQDTLAGVTVLHTQAAHSCGEWESFSCIVDCPGNIICRFPYDATGLERARHAQTPDQKPELGQSVQEKRQAW